MNIRVQLTHTCLSREFQIKHVCELVLNILKRNVIVMGVGNA